MHIEIPEWHEYGREVLTFIDDNLSELQQYKLADRLEYLQRLSYHDLVHTHKLEKIENRLYELRVPILSANVRFLGKLCGPCLYLLYAFPKKRQKLTSKQVMVGQERAQLFPCPLPSGESQK